MNGIHHLFAYTDDIYIAGENIDTIQKNTKALLGASKEDGLEVRPKKTKYMLVSYCQKAGQKHSIKTVNRSFECVAKFKYLGTTLTDQKCMHKEIKSRLNSGNASYHLVQSLLSSHLLYRNVKIKVYKTLILPVVFHGCVKLISHTKEEHRLRVFEKRVLRRISGPKRDKVIGEWRKLYNEKPHNSYSSPNIRQNKSRRMRWVGRVEHMGEDRKV
jgi:hypothetical protein